MTENHFSINLLLITDNYHLSYAIMLTIKIGEDNVSINLQLYVWLLKNGCSMKFKKHSASFKGELHLSIRFSISVLSSTPSHIKN